MATAVGAGVAGQFDMVHGEPYDTRTTYPDAVVLSYPYGILVNGKAERFLDEGVEPLDMTFEPFSYEIWRNQDNEAYLIGDQSMVEVPYFELLNTTDKEPETADTLAELAGKLGLDPAALEATVAQFNAACPTRRSTRRRRTARRPRASSRRRRTGRTPSSAGRSWDGR